MAILTSFTCTASQAASAFHPIHTNQRTDQGRRSETMADSRQMFKSGQAKGQAEEKTRQWIDSAKDTANAAREKACEAAQSAADSAEQGQQQATGFLQQTGEQIKSMAQGAAEGVKQTLGMGEQTSK